MWHVARGMWHVARGMWHVARGMWHVVGLSCSCDWISEESSSGATPGSSAGGGIGALIARIGICSAGASSPYRLRPAIRHRRTCPASEHKASRMARACTMHASLASSSPHSGVGGGIRGSPLAPKAGAGAAPRGTAWSEPCAGACPGGAGDVAPTAGAGNGGSATGGGSSKHSSWCTRA